MVRFNSAKPTQGFETVIRCKKEGANNKTHTYMKHSNTRFLVEYLGILIASYLVLTGFIAFIGDVNYRELLSSPGQIYALLLLYSWLPIPRMLDLERENKPESLHQV